NSKINNHLQIEKAYNVWIYEDFQPLLDDNMKDTKEAQYLEFLDICENLKKIFDEILGYSNNMDGFIIIEEKDIYLLENAFT
ncbi:3862_t:CDS:2, partial [Gigaspora margarita]